MTAGEPRPDNQAANRRGFVPRKTTAEREWAHERYLATGDPMFLGQTRREVNTLDPDS